MGSKIVVDVYICGAPTAPVEITEGGNTIDHILRKHALHKYYYNIDSMAQDIRANPDLNLRYVVLQSDQEHMGGLNELNFEGDFTWKAQMDGRQDAKDAIDGLK